MRVLIADDHDLLRDTLALYLEGTGGLGVRAVSDLSGALMALEREGPFEVALLDLDMPGMEGLAGLGRALAAAGGRPVALMSGQATRAEARRALAIGAAGFLPKTMTPGALVGAVRLMATGERFAPLDVMTAEDEAGAGLSARERQMLRALAEGKSDKRIALDLDLREPTVMLHMKTLFRKLGAANRTQAALIGRESGLA